MPYQTEFDANLQRVAGLTWLPWIGKKYALGKVLVLGESHYCYCDNTPDVIERRREETREVIATYVQSGRDAGNQYKTYEPMEEVLRTSIIKGKPQNELWSQVAFMNLIQKCMDSNTERPDWQLFLKGWQVVLQVVNVLRPKVCICFSTDKMRNRVNFNRLEEFKDKINFYYSIVTNEDTDQRIARCIVAKPGRILIESYDCPVIFVQHASRIKGQALKKWSDVITQLVDL